MVGIWLLLSNTIEKVVEKEAKSTAVGWADYFVYHLENTETLIETGRPDLKQARTIDKAVEFGEVFRFKVFRPDGTNSFISDEYKDRPDEELQRVENQKARDVFITGASNIAIKDGTKKPSRPDVYVEAYVPIQNELGKRIGVVEVYIDQTDIVASMKDGFYWIALFLPFICALLFLIPTLGMLRESASAKKAKANAEQLANFDSLTGLYNRRYFNETAEKYFLKFKTVGTLFIDIDDFKRINDEHGHHGGDTFLRNVAKVLKNKLGKNTICSRFGGDEFVACVGNISTYDLQAMTSEIIDEINKGVSHREQKIFGHVSIGMSIMESTEPLSEMLHTADTALYQAKAEGKNTTIFFSDELNHQLKRQKKLERLLHRAINGKGLELFFQPINQPVTKQVLGFEALLRLRDEQGIIVFPDEFIPIAEKLGLIKDIGKWVLEEAVKTAKKWPVDKFISVNLSSVQFEDGNLPIYLNDILLKHHLPAKQLEVEVTESLLIKDDGHAQKQLSEIKKLGISIAMDDFGTGYSSLGYLWKYEFDKLKVDRSFLQGYEHDPQKLTKVIGSIIDLGHYINMSVTIEGVENEEHADILKGLGCDQLQGYYFGKPMPLTNAELMLAA